MTLTDEQIEEIKARAEAATPGELGLGTPTHFRPLPKPEEM